MTTPFIRPTSPGFPEPELIRHYRNVILQFKKTIQSSKEIEPLKMEMEHFINASRRVTWPHATGAVYHKDEAEKAVVKVVTEFERYIKNLEAGSLTTHYQDLMDALAIVETMIDRLRGR